MISDNVRILSERGKDAEEGNESRKGEGKRNKEG
jgi:hypothetical protein